MSLRRPTVPDRVKKAYLEGLGNFIAPGDPLWRVFGETHPGDHQTHQVHHEAHPVFSLGLRDIWQEKKKLQQIDGKELKSTRPAGWRFVAADENIVGACHVGESPDTDQTGAKLTGLSRVGGLRVVLESIRKLESLPEVVAKTKKRDFDLRMLRVPGAVEAFWVYSPTDSPSDDLIIPFYTSNIRELPTMKTYTPAKFVKALFNVAKKRLESELYFADYAS